MFGINEEEVRSINKGLAENPRTNDRRICICGHSMSRHKESKTGNPITGYGCKPVSFSCPCKRMKPIFEVKNTRYFIARSINSGDGHALVRGLIASKDAIEDFEAGVTLISEIKCDNENCGAPTDLFPVRTDEFGFRLYDDNTDQGHNLILCEKCRTVYWDSEKAKAVRTSHIKVVPDINK